MATNRRQNYGRDYGYNRGMYRGNARRYNIPLYGDQNGDQDNWNDYDYDYNFNPGQANTQYWSNSGPYAGVGPDNYQRSDVSIREDINERLTRHGRINARDIQVNVENGEVTLRGAVHSRGEKRMAEDVADSVSGVRDVYNQLQITG